MTILDAWYRKHAWLWLLWPLSVLFTLLARQRRARLQRTWPPEPADIPVVVVGNITVGGTGKSPFVIALVRQLQVIGLRPDHDGEPSYRIKSDLERHERIARESELAWIT